MLLVALFFDLGVGLNIIVAMVLGVKAMVLNKV